PEAAEQENFITEAVRTLEGRHLALFMHKPLYNDTLADTEVSGHAVNPMPRRRLMAALGSITPRLVCCGHRHEYREQTVDGLHQIWAPATSFTIADWFLPTHGGVHLVGYVRLALEPDGSFQSELVQPYGLLPLDLADFPEAYGDLRQIKAAME